MLPVVVPHPQQAALGLAGGAGHPAAAGSTIPVGDPTAAAADPANWDAAKKRVAVAADNQEATSITSYAKPDFVKQLIRTCHTPDCCVSVSKKGASQRTLAGSCVVSVCACGKGRLDMLHVTILLCQR